MILGQCTSSGILRICICMPVHLVTIRVRSRTQPMRALGTTIELPRREPLSRFEYYLPLTDTLAYCPDPSGHLRELSDSFGHDILNLATLASRLLWYEGVVPRAKKFGLATSGSKEQQRALQNSPRRRSSRVR